MNWSDDTFCILPWIHLHANPNGDVLPCCIGDWRKPLGNLQTESLEDIWNGDRYKQLRKLLLTGQKPEECKQCWAHEASGNESNRIARNKRFEHLIDVKNLTEDDGHLNKMDFAYVDVRWSNICNYKCRSCSSTFSSSWAKEDNTNGRPTKTFRFAGGDNNDKLYNDLKPHLEHVEEYYFAGGEPLLTDKHYEVLDYMLELGRTDLKLEYNTNLSVLQYKDKNVLDYWNKFDDVTLRVSLDHYDSRAEYIREGTDWKTVATNLAIVKNQCPKVKLSFNTVVSCFNVVKLGDLLLMLQYLGIDVNSGTLYNIVEPSAYSLDVLPQALLDEASENINNYRQYVKNERLLQQIDGVLNTINNAKFDKTKHQRFIRMTEYYDKIRNRDFVSTFPELKLMKEFA